ncbi:MAG TPA: O-antigen ligase family protein, partial [Pyrinomonadaceae bacterium]|nr:O-antigen ligase family protein [Pyrinomonadaceae bacterium]
AVLIVIISSMLAATLWVVNSSSLEGASRSDFWESTLKMFAANPVLGVGLGGYWIGITAYHDASGRMVPQEAHNDYLELLSSGGVIGFAIGLWFVVIAVRMMRRNRFADRGFMRAARLGALLGLAGVAAHSLVDFGLHIMVNAVVFITLIMIATTNKVIDLNPQEQ